MRAINKYNLKWIVGGVASRGPVFLIRIFLLLIFVMILSIAGVIFESSALAADKTLPKETLKLIVMSEKEPIAQGYVDGLPDNTWLLMFEKLDGKFKVVRRLKQNDAVSILARDIKTKTDPYGRVFHEIRVGNAEGRAGIVEGFVDRTYIRIEGESPSTAVPQAQASPSPTPPRTQATTPAPARTPLLYGRVSGVPDGLLLQAFTELDGMWDLAFQVREGTRVGILAAFVSTEYDEHRFHLITYQGKIGYVASDFIQIE